MEVTLVTKVLLLGVALYIVCCHSTVDAVCSRTFTEALQFRIQAEELSPVNISTGAQLISTLSTTWTSSSPSFSLRYAVIHEQSLNVSSSVLCDGGGGILLDCLTWQWRPCVIRGLDIFLLSPGCSFFTRGIRMEQCGSGGRGSCLLLDNCPLVALHISEFSL